MGYCSSIDVQRVLAQSLTTATAQTTDELGTLENLLNVGNTLDNNLVSNDVINYYIQMADRETDASLSELYSTSFCEMANFETALYSDIYEYNSYIVLERPCPLAVGDQIIIVENSNEERHEIEEVVNPTIYATSEPIQYYFDAGARIIRVTYPDPIRFISARKSAANIYDKYFSAEVSPSTSTYGERLRELALTELNNILNGRTILHGQHRIGRRFYNSNLVDQYALPSGGEISKEMRQIK